VAGCFYYVVWLALLSTLAVLVGCLAVYTLLVDGYVDWLIYLDIWICWLAIDDISGWSCWLHILAGYPVSAGWLCLLRYLRIVLMFVSYIIDVGWLCLLAMLLNLCGYVGRL
jgi:hypothetical protein